MTRVRGRRPHRRHRRHRARQHRRPRTRRQRTARWSRPRRGPTAGTSDADRREHQRQHEQPKLPEAPRGSRYALSFVHQRVLLSSDQYSQHPGREISLATTASRVRFSVAVTGDRRPLARSGRRSRTRCPPRRRPCNPRPRIDTRPQTLSDIRIPRSDGQDPRRRRRHIPAASWGNGSSSTDHCRACP